MGPLEQYRQTLAVGWPQLVLNWPVAKLHTSSFGMLYSNCGCSPLSKRTDWSTSLLDTGGQSFILILHTQQFCHSYTEAFKGYSPTTMCCNVRTTRNTLLQKNKRAIYSNDLDDNGLDRVTSFSVHMYYPHYRICDLLWFGFEKLYFHNAKNVLGIPSRPNSFDPNDRMPLLSDDDLDDMIGSTEQLCRVFHNTNNQQRNQWIWATSRDCLIYQTISLLWPNNGSALLSLTPTAHLSS